MRGALERQIVASICGLPRGEVRAGGRIRFSELPEWIWPVHFHYAPFGPDVQRREHDPALGSRYAVYKGLRAGGAAAAVS